jgi:hypothetical protein
MAATQVIDQNNKDLGKKEVKIYSDHCGPYRVDYEGREYWSTGKSGNNIKTGKPSIEMATEDDQRLWITVDETLINLD